MQKNDSMYLYFSSVLYRSIPITIPQNASEVATSLPAPDGAAGSPKSQLNPSWGGPLGLAVGSAPVTASPPLLPLGLSDGEAVVGGGIGHMPTS